MSSARSPQRSFSLNRSLFICAGVCVCKLEGKVAALFEWTFAFAENARLSKAAINLLHQRGTIKQGVEAKAIRAVALRAGLTRTIVKCEKQSGNLMGRCVPYTEAFNTQKP